MDMHTSLVDGNLVLDIARLRCEVERVEGVFPELGARGDVANQ